MEKEECDKATERLQREKGNGEKMSLGGNNKRSRLDKKRHLEKDKTS